MGSEPFFIALTTLALTAVLTFCILPASFAGDSWQEAWIARNTYHGRLGSAEAQMTLGPNFPEDDHSTQVQPSWLPQGLTPIPDGIWWFENRLYPPYPLPPWDQNPYE